MRSKNKNTSSVKQINPNVINQGEKNKSPPELQKKKENKTEWMAHSEVQK